VGQVAADVVFGAGLGWFFYTFGYALMADDHGALYRQGRRQWIIGGSLIGGTLGVVQAATTDCVHAPDREPRRR
jgi:hypothetical protein